MIKRRVLGKRICAGHEHAFFEGVCEQGRCIKLAATVLMLLASGLSTCEGASYTIEPSNPSCTHKIMGGGTIGSPTDTCKIIVPNDTYADVTYSYKRTNLAYCNKSSININPLPTNSDGTIRFYTDDEVSVSVTAYDPMVSWAEPISGVDGTILYHVYHYYESYYAEYEYTISAQYVSLKPDLVVKSASAEPAITYTGKSVTINYVVANNGNASAGPSTASIYCDGNWVADQAVPTLGSKGTASFSYTFPAGFSQEKTYNITITANANGVVAESSTANNSYSCMVRVPFLTISSQSLSAFAQSSAVEAKINTNVPCKSESDVWWLTAQTDELTDSGTLVYMAARNTSTVARTGHISVWNDYGKKKTITVTQAGMTLADVVATTASDGTSSEYVQVEWGASSRALSYTLQRADSEAGPWTDIRTGATSPFRDTAVVPGKRYWYRVLAVNEAGKTTGTADAGMKSISLRVTAPDVACNAASVQATIPLACNHEWMVMSDADWIKFEPSAGTGDAMVTCVMKKNYTTEVRTATIKVTSGSEVRTVSILQAGQVLLDQDTGSVVIDTGANSPTLTLGDGTIHYGTVSNGLAVFWFDYFRLGKNVSVSVKGSRPLVIESETDMKIAADIDVSGSIAGRCGGGVGGAGGKGGESAGGEGGERGQFGSSGGQFGHTVYTTGYGGTGGAGGVGKSGSSVSGCSGESASSHFGAGSGVAAGGNGGAAATVVGQPAAEQVALGGARGAPGSTNGKSCGGKGSNGTDGKAAVSAGGTGGVAGNGETGRNDMSQAVASTKIVCGAGGGGGGGGGSGGSGAGGNGGGGGGGGGGCALGAGGAGGYGGKGGNGGDAGAGGEGGAGGNGGGGIMLLAHGILEFQGKVNVSAFNPDGTIAGKAGKAGGAGQEGDPGVSGHSSPNHSISHTWGGANNNGGDGGHGGAGSSGGSGGRGGDGGYGAPGMVKLCGSLIVANGGRVVADNGNGDTADNRCGAVTFISNMTATQRTAGEPSYSQKVLKGSCRYDDVLLVESVYSASVKVPILGQLKTVRADVCGICADGNHVLAKAANVAVESSGYGLQVKRVSGVYEGFDQLFVANVSGKEKSDGGVWIAGKDVAIGLLKSGETWTTCVPTGAAVRSMVAESLPVTCKVTFGKNGGTGGDNYVTATYGAAMPTPRTAPTQSGWTFAGYWDTLAMDEKGNPKGKQYYDANMKSVRAWDKKGAATLWAKWTNKVTFGKNGGTGGDNYVTCTKGQPMPKRTMPTKSGYVFDGYWNTTGAGGVKYYNADGTSAHAWDRSGNVTLWAKWVKPVACKVTFGKNGGSGGDNYVTATTGQPMPTPRTAPKRTGWTFAGYWDTLAQDANGNPTGRQYYDANMKSVRVWDKTSAATLWAKWTVRVKLGKNGGTGGDDYVTVTYNQPFPKRTMPTRTGYTFGGYWVSASSKTGQCYNTDGTGTSTMKWSTGGTPTVWALWTKVSSCVEPPASTVEQSAIPAVAAAPAKTIPAGLYFGVLADGSGTYWLMLDEPEEGYDRTAYVCIVTETGTTTAECTIEETDGLLVLTTDDGEIIAVDPVAGSASRL